MLQRNPPPQNKYTTVIMYVESQIPYYFAYHPEFGKSACSGAGNTVQEALESLENTRRDVLEHYRKSNRLIPMPEVMVG